MNSADKFWTVYTCITLPLGIWLIIRQWKIDMRKPFKRKK